MINEYEFCSEGEIFDVEMCSLSSTDVNGDQVYPCSHHKNNSKDADVPMETFSHLNLHCNNLQISLAEAANHNSTNFYATEAHQNGEEVYEPKAKRFRLDEIPMANDKEETYEPKARRLPLDEIPTANDKEETYEPKVKRLRLDGRPAQG